MEDVEAVEAPKALNDTFRIGSEGGFKVLELRQYKNESMEWKFMLVLKLLRFLSDSIGK